MSFYGPYYKDTSNGASLFHQLAFAKNLGAHFSTLPVDKRQTDLFHWIRETHIDFKDSNYEGEKWITLEGNYTAVGGERYLTIGNFDYWIETDFYDPDSKIDSFDLHSMIAIDSVRLWEENSIDTLSPNANLPGDTVFCSQPVDLLVEAAAGFDQYIWNTGDSTRSLHITEPGIYIVSVDKDCSYCNDTIVVSHYDDLSFDLGPDQVYCKDLPPLAIGNLDSVWTNFTWSSGDTLNELNISAPGLYWLEASYPCGASRDSILIELIDQPVAPFVEGNDILCVGSGSYQPQANGQNLRWFDEFQQFLDTVPPIIDPMEIGFHRGYVSQTIRDCESELSPYVLEIKDQPDFPWKKNDTLCDFQASSYGPNEWSWQYLWSDGSEKSPRLLSDGGGYEISVSNECGTTIKELNLHVEDCNCNVFAPNAITINQDHLNDQWSIKFDCIGIHDFQVRIFNRWGEEIMYSEDPNFSWNAQNIGLFAYMIQYRSPSTSNTEHKKGYIMVLE
jgi:hypothetical protein